MENNNGPKNVFVSGCKHVCVCFKVEYFNVRVSLLGPLEQPLEEVEISGVFVFFVLFSSLSTKPLIAAVVCRL